MKLIVGLGNPGDKYQGTKHNLGFEVLDQYVRKHVGGSAWEVEKKFKAEIVCPTPNSEPLTPNLILAKPLTFMNNSGMAVRLLLDYYKIAPEDIIVIHDELDLPLGKIKIRLGGAGAGHHGVESIINYLGTDKFIRVRLGIGNVKTQLGEHKKEHISAEEFVISAFPGKEKNQAKKMIKKAVQALELLLKEGLEKAQSQYN